MPERNGPPAWLVSRETLVMRRLLLLVLLAAPAALITGCSRSNPINEATFYGTWTKGTHAGDTLVFSRKSGLNILRYNLSFNDQLPVYIETEFKVQEERLYVTLPFTMTAMISNFVAADNFTWINKGRQFSMKGNQLWPILAQADAQFTFTKLY